MLCLCGFTLVVLGSQPFRILLEMFFVLFFSVLSAIEQSTADTVINKWQGPFLPAH